MSTNKLENIPKTYYLNLDSREDRREHTENQFKTFGIKNYERISASKFLASEFDTWKHLVFNSHREIYKSNLQHRVELGTAVSYIDFLESWLRTTSDPYLILMEDDHDLSYIDDWHFDWNYLMSRLPYDWDCIQLGFENHWEIPCYLHPIHPYHTLGPSLMKRRYAEKLVEIHRVDGLYNFHQQNCNFKWSAKKDWSVSFIHPDTERHIVMQGSARPTPSTSDYFLGHCGKTYCLPLITLNPYLGSYETDYHRTDREELTFTRRAYDLWWKKLKNTKSLETFFSYGKPYDFSITRANINHLSEQYETVSHSS
jgi:hypothetical protein